MGETGKNINSANEKEVKDFLSQIAQHLILNTSYSDNLGLYHGKMGIILFFCYYSKYIDNTLYDDFAGELLDEIYDDISRKTLINFEDGLCGIGWCIEYLIQHDFLSGDADKILSHLDARIMELNPKRIKDISFRTGLGGILYYSLVRINSSRKKKTNMPFDNSYVSDLYNAAKEVTQIGGDLGFKFLLDNLLYGDCEEGMNIFSSPIYSLICGNTQNSIRKKVSLGLENGYAGAGLKRVLPNLLLINNKCLALSNSNIT